MKSIGPRLVIATHNAGKLREIQELLAPYGIECVGAAELGLPEPFPIVIQGQSFSLIWSIIGAALFVAVISLISGRRR